jgi:hypothetical protein
MKCFYKSIGALLFFIFSFSALAESGKPLNSGFFLEYSLDASGFKFRVNDVPATSPSYEVGTMGNVKSRFLINQLLYKGKNVIEIYFKIKDESAGGARFRFFIKNSKEKSEESYNDGYVFDFKVAVNKNDNSVKIIETAGAQAISDVVFLKVEGSGALEEWNRYRISFELANDFYDSEYRKLAVDLSQEDFEEIVNEYEKIYKSIEYGSIKPLLKSYLHKYSADTGMTEEEIYESLFSDFNDPDFGYELGAFNASKSDLALVGNGKLALLDPSPIYYLSETLGRKESIIIMLWKDKNGIWKIKD